MKVKIPSEIKLGAYSYTLTLEENHKLNDGNWGSVNHTLSTIVIDKGLPSVERDLCFLHECIHIISEQYRLKLEEDDTERLQNGLGELLFRDLDIQFDWSGIKEK